MTAKIRRIDFSPDEWLSGTRELTLEERGAYWDVCALIYSRGGPIADDAAWITKALTCHGNTWRAIRARLIAKGKLTTVDGMLRNGRSLREISRAQNRLKSSAKAAQNSGKLRAKPSEKDPESNDYKEITEASAQVSRRANYQLPTTKEKKDRSSLAEISIDPARATPASRSRSRAMPPDWQPQEATIARLRTARPDLDDATIARRNVEFFAWCAETAKTTFNPDATWLGFMVKTHVQPDQTKRRTAGRGAATVHDGVAAAFARRSVPPRG